MRHSLILFACALISLVVHDTPLLVDARAETSRPSFTADSQVALGKRMAAIFELSPKLGWYFFIAREIG